MSESMPKSSRTLAILSGDAISVAARLSGWTLGRSVIGQAFRRRARRPQLSRDLRRQREERQKTLHQRHVSLDLDQVERRAAVYHRHHVLWRAAENGLALLEVTPHYVDMTTRDGHHIGDVAEAEADARI